MNKTEYLVWLRRRKACAPALEWVESRPEDSARDILLACDRVDWLCWNVGRKSPTKVAEFARRCADRTAYWAAASRAAEAAYWAEARAAASAAARAAYWAAEAADRAAASAAARAAYWAAEAADRAADRADERRLQLDDLHTLVKEVF